MLQFITRFPAEITLEIVSYLDQLDTIECMCVCRHWHSVIPGYALRVWNQVYVSWTSWDKTNDCMIQCLKHVQHLTIKDRDSRAILSKFKKSPLSRLEIKSHSLSLTTDLQLISYIEPFAKTLTELSITDHPFNLSLVDLLEALPNLTHLTFLFDAKRFKQLPYSRHHKKEDSRVFSSNLAYLHLDNAHDFDLEMAPLFGRCPELVSLLLSTRFPKEPGNGFEISVDLSRTAKLCPHLRYIMLNQGKYAVQEDHRRGDFWKQMSKVAKVKNGEQGVRELIFYGDESNFDKILPTLRGSRRTLEHVSLSSLNDNPWDTLADVHFHQLKTLNMWYAKVEEQAWNRFLTTNGVHLERLDLSLVTNPKHLPAIVKAINSMEKLSQLRLFNSSRFCNHPNQEYGLGALSKNPKLRILDLSNVCILDDEIVGLCQSQSLLELSILMSHDHCACITVAGFLEFADKLKNSNSNISFLWFENCHNITDAVLDSLAYVKSLSTLSISGNTRITDEGVRSFLGVNNDDGKKSIEIYGCPIVSRQGIWTIDDEGSDESSSVEYDSC